MLCCVCLLIDKDEKAVTHVQGTAMCRDHAVTSQLALVSQLQQSVSDVEQLRQSVSDVEQLRQSVTV